GGLPATVARRTETGWRTGRKIYSTGAPILKWNLVWARTDEPEPRVGQFLVTAGLPGTRIVETWDHLGLRASGSHDVVFDDVVLPLDHEIDVRRPADWRGLDVSQAATHTVLLPRFYDGIARAARDWLIEFVRQRVPSSLGAPLATLALVQEVVGGIEARLVVNARLIDSFAGDFDDGYRDVLCGRATDFIRRLAAARAWSLTNPNRYAETWGRLMNIPTVVPLNWLSRAKVRIAPIDDSVTRDEQSTIDLYFRWGLIKRKLSVDEIVDRSFSDAISKGAGL
ncbi:acyl-CoA dehydrogenase family protein, partial [Bradyrhizobium sp. NAS80.1]|uniref:acyl-CoA dehydrogenase family protein n=1 Tax=Bradyrhizobium sp. NAS80.1 TaxID=1680159 RepID=UPI000AB19802